jgi:hypothetical protein
LRHEAISASAATLCGFVLATAMDRQLRRHWIITSAALSYFLFAAVDLWGWFLYHGQIVTLGEQDPIGRRVLGGLYLLLAMLPTPSLIFWLKFALSRWLQRPVLQFGATGLLYHLFVVCLSVLVGYGLLRMREWARWSLASFCVLAVAVDLHLFVATIRMAQRFPPDASSVTWNDQEFLFQSAPPLLGTILALALLVFVLRHGLQSKIPSSA